MSRGLSRKTQCLRLHAPREPPRTGLASQNRLQPLLAERTTSIPKSPPTTPARRKSLHNPGSFRGGSSYSTLCNLSLHPESNTNQLHTVTLSKKRTNNSPLFTPLKFFSPYSFFFPALIFWVYILGICMTSDSTVSEYPMSRLYLPHHLVQ